MKKNLFEELKNIDNKLESIKNDDSLSPEEKAKKCTELLDCDIFELIGE